MPRLPRIEFEDAGYHVFSRGNRREAIFRDDRDYACFERVLLEAASGSEVLLFDWSLMPNHFHLNIRTPHGNLSQFMRRLLTRYAIRFNRRHGLVGHLFQGRYGARLVDHEAYFKEIVRYVELNPYRVKTAKLAEVGQWKWSSFRYYKLPVSQWPEACRKAFGMVLEHFGATPASARQALAQFLADGLEKGDWEAFYKVKDRRFIGSDAFVEQMKRGLREPARAQPRPARPNLRWSDILERFESISGRTIADLAAPGKDRTLARWRQALVFVARRFYQIPLVEIARTMGRSDGTVSLMWTRHRDIVLEWSETKRLLGTLGLMEVTVAEMQNANNGTKP